MGRESLQAISGAAAQNTAIGKDAGAAVTTGSSNTFLGYDAGDATTTSTNNTIIGNGADASSATVSNEITLGNASVNKFRIPGMDFVIDAGNVGIGTSSPTGSYKLDVVGAIGGPSANFVIYPSPGVSAKRTLSLSNNANATLHLDHDGGYNRFGSDNTSQHFAFCAGGSTAGDINVVFKGDGNVGIGTTSPAKQLHITKAAIADIGTLTDGATITPDFDANQNFSVTLGGNRTLANPTNIDAGQTGSIFITQDGTGTRTLAFGSYWKFPGGTAPTLSTAAAAVDRLDYIVFSSTDIHAIVTLDIK